jgi:3-oxoacyl-[acyl-carrier-protein] synthase II
LSPLAVKNNLIPPTINLENPSPDCDSITPRSRRRIERSSTHEHSFGFGGHNATLVFKKV